MHVKYEQYSIEKIAMNFLQSGLPLWWRSFHWTFEVFSFFFFFSFYFIFFMCRS